MNKTARPRSQKSRQLLDIAVEARMQYADHLRSVADGKQAADQEEKERLKKRCEETLKAWQEIHHAWRDSNWLTAGRHQASKNLS